MPILLRSSCLPRLHSRWQAFVLHNTTSSSSRLIFGGTSPRQLSITHANGNSKSNQEGLEAKGTSKENPSRFPQPDVPAKIVPGPAERRLHGRKILVTGGTSGIGYAIVQRFVEEGASHIAIVSRSKERAQEAIEKVQRGSGTSDILLSVIQGDIREHGSLVSSILKTWKSTHFDTLINCAGMSQSQLLLQTSDDEIQNILQTNLESAMVLSKMLLGGYSRNLYHHSRSTKESARAGSKPEPPAVPSYCIVNVSSLLAVQGGVGASVYAGSKAGLIAFSRAVALEAGQMRAKYGAAAPPFRVNTVVPGYIETPMLAGMSREKLESAIPLGRLGTPAEVADAAVFLVSNEYANNCVLNLDGGLSAV